MTIKLSRPSFVHEDSRFYQFFSKLINSIEQGINSIQQSPGQVAVNDLSELSTFTFSGISDGFLVYVIDLRCPWELVRESTATPDGITVIAAIGGGNWLQDIIQLLFQFRIQICLRLNCGINVMMQVHH